MDEKNGLIFGIYPFGNAGMADGVATGKPDDFNKIGAAVMELKGDAPEFMVRSYTHYTGNNELDILSQIEQLLQIPVDWDMVLCFRRPGGGDLNSWLEMIRTIITRHGERLNTLQITNEANIRNMPSAGDGYFPAAREALVKGVIAARQTIAETSSGTNIGFNAVPTTNAADDFWNDLKNLGDGEFSNSLDYVGLDLYPDVFGGPVAIDDIPAVVTQIIENFRHVHLAAAGIPESVPIRITENGWPTNSGRPPERQAQVIDGVIRTIHTLRNKLNITHYELFNLRDADSSNDNIFHQFGILRDDYTPKPAFAAYKELIGALGRTYQRPAKPPLCLAGVPAPRSA